MRRLIWLFFAALIAETTGAATYNDLILDQVHKMPSGGKYSVYPAAVL